VAMNFQLGVGGSGLYISVRNGAEGSEEIVSKE
jgi:hypothetical protein